MISRYRIEEIHDIWSVENKYKNWFEIEILVCEAWNFLGILPNLDLKLIKEQAKYNIDEINELEKIYKHDVIAFTRCLSNNIKNNAKKWIHFGLTSTDLVDSSNGLNFKKSNEIIINDTNKLLITLKNLSIKYKLIKQMGRTHGVHAQVNSLGLKFLNYFKNISLWLNDFNLIKKNVEVIKLSGAIGNYSFQNPKIEEFVSNKLNINIAHNSTQVISRHRHALYFSSIANLGLLIEQIATEIRHLHRTEVNEVCEAFSKNQKGSSAMPHKKNPILCENICGMSRLLSSLCHTTWQNVNLWHERDISHSSNERIVFEDSINTIVYLIRTLNNVLENIVINKIELEDNIKLSNNKNISQAILLHLIKYVDDSRENLYDYIQELSLKNHNILEEIKNSRYSHLFQNELWNEFIDNSNELKYIEYIYKKAFN